MGGAQTITPADNAAISDPGVDDEWFAVRKEQRLADKCAVPSKRAHAPGHTRAQASAGNTRADANAAGTAARAVSVDTAALALAALAAAAAAPAPPPPTPSYAIPKKSGNIFRVGIFLDFVWLTTRTPHGGASYVRGARRNRIDPPWG